MAGDMILCFQNQLRASLSPKPPLYRTLAKLSTKYGPVFSLQLGTRLVVAVSSASAAEECFTKNDIVFANRPRLTISKYIGYNYTTVGDSPYGDHWRNLRRLCALEIFSNNRLNNFQPIRQHEINNLVHRVFHNSGDNFGTPVDLKSKLFQMSYNIIMRMVAGKRYYGEEEDNELGGKSFSLSNYVLYIFWTNELKSLYSVSNIMR
ncbi:hypothetical protein H5410_009087 [Solanum commersonii]|uniref:Cytochrome P450 n=1 Tax=Solanum commersonii TaxID=4109 RepID=A0A9J6AGU6_SOLCO|nr:hypothetical protein H5410_009087 [Solanum commersonii]